MNFYEFLRIVEDEDSPKRLDNPNVEQRPSLSQSDFERDVRVQMANQGKRASHLQSRKKVSPLGFLAALQKGQDAVVMIDPTGKGQAQFDTNWKVIRWGGKYIVLEKNVAQGGVGGQLIVPQEIFVNWQTSYHSQNKKARRRERKNTEKSSQFEPYDIPDNPSSEEDFFHPKPQPGENWNLPVD